MKHDGMVEVPRPCRNAKCPRFVTDTKPCPDHQWRRPKPKHEALKGLDRSIFDDPTTVCWLCGRREVPPIFKDQRWAFDHTNPRDPNSRKRPSHFACNTSRGQQPVGVWRVKFRRRMKEWRDRQQVDV